MITLTSMDFSAIQGMNNVDKLPIPDDGNCKLPCVCGNGSFDFYTHILAVRSGIKEGVILCPSCGRTVSYKFHQGE